MSLFKKKINENKDNETIKNTTDIKILKYIKDNTLDSGYMSNSFSDVHAQKIKRKVMNGEVVYHLLNPNIDEHKLDELIKKSSPKVTLPIFETLFDENIYLSFDDTTKLLQLENHDFSMELIMEMINHEIINKKISYNFSYIITALLKYPEISKKYVGEKSAHDICFLGNFTELHDIGESDVSAYDNYVLTIISFALFNDLSFDEIVNEINGIDNNDNIHPLLYFRLACKIRNVDKRWLDIPSDIIMKALQGMEYTRLSSLGRMSNRYSSQYGFDYSKHDITHFLSQIKTDEMWSDIEVIIREALYRNSIYNAPDSWGERYDDLSIIGQLVLHRNFPKHYTLELFNEITQLDSNRVESIIFGLDDDLDVTKYISIDNTLDTMEMVRINLRQSKVNKLSGIEEEVENG